MSVLIFIVLVAIGATFLGVTLTKASQLDYIGRYSFHTSIRSKLLQKHPQLTQQQTDHVFECLRDFFRICHKANQRIVSMPSQIVDDAWHEFILFTRSYHRFCNKAFGRFLHHTPAEAMRTPTQAQDGIKRAWRLACSLENIHPKRPSRLPRLFAIDGLLRIGNGFIFQLDCSPGTSKRAATIYCASHIGCSSGCSGDVDTDGGDFSDDSNSGCSDGCSGGCGGD